MISHKSPILAFLENCWSRSYVGSMLKQFIVFSLLIPLSLFFSCDSHEKHSLSAYLITQKDFEEYIVVDGYVEPVSATSLGCPRNIEGVLAFILEEGTRVEKGDTVAIIEVQELQTEYDQLLISLETAEAGLEKTKAELVMQYALLEADVRNNEANAQIASLDSMQLKYSPETQRRISELELRKVSIEKEKIGKKLKALSVIQQSEIKKKELEIERFANRVKSTKQRLDELVLRAPKKGLIVRGRNYATGAKFQLGDPVWGGMPVVNIPELAAMKVKILALEKDYKYISVKDSVSYSFDAMPENIAWGRILSKSPVGQPYKRDSKVKFFEIEASIDSCLALPDVGFTANCRVSLKQLGDTLVVPLVAVFEEDSMRVVFVQSEAGYERRQIRTGISSLKEAVVEAGLKEKETIVLEHPLESQIKKTTLLPDSVRKATNN